MSEQGQKMKEYKWTVIEDDGHTYSEQGSAKDIAEAFWKAVEYNPAYVKFIQIEVCDE